MEGFLRRSFAMALKTRNNKALLIRCILFLAKLPKNSVSRFILFFGYCLLYQGVSGVAADDMSVTEGDSVNLTTDVKANQQDKIRWYHNDIRIAEINGDLSKICTDVQCNEGTEVFRGRLKLDNQTGSLTIRNIRTSDAGDYHLKISRGNNETDKRFNVTVHGFFSAGKDGVSVFVMERDSVTFQTGVETNQQSKIRWYFNKTRIAEISGDHSKICTDVQCNEGTERFRDRLKLDHQTGSLTITNITNTDAGVYELVIGSKIHDKSDPTFHFAVHNVYAAGMKKNGESVTLYADALNYPNDVITWSFNGILIAGGQSKVCTDEQCDERLRDRLHLHYQTGSLTIMNITNKDPGVYTLQINSNRTIIFRKFTVLDANVRNAGPPSTAAPGASAAVIGGAVVGILLIAAVTVLICHCHKKHTEETATQNDTPRQPAEENSEENPFLSEQNMFQINSVNGRTTDHHNQ